MKVSAKKENVQVPMEKIYQRITTLSDFGKILPPNISNISCSDDSCKFSISRIGDFTVNIRDKKLNNYVVYDVQNDKNIPITLTITLEEEKKQLIAAEIEAEVPLFLSSMVKKPLQYLVEQIVERIEEVAEK